ncbi:RkpR, polysaccharide export protein [Rhizobium gallicum]|uniref:RkpR, polysaccharide export protein n=1 Tax=Rhizobium gallicum TaxID=56730 RepID=UPI001EF94315|nr:RkpR, polysaccharide export protein [Rhizobium gallicum]ULJ72355.1 RkpR, polysaccharide export protein [Rhizobium gallicum]
MTETFVKPDGDHLPVSARAENSRAIAVDRAKTEPNFRLLFEIPNESTTLSPKPSSAQPLIREIPGVVDPDKLSGTKPPLKIKLRHRVIALSFIAVVALPAAVTSGYLAFIAADQYDSSASFAVRSIQSAAATDILGMFSQASPSSTVGDSFILMEYIRSKEMVAELERHFDLDKLFERRGLDFFFAMPSGLPIEEKVEYWRRMVDIRFDQSSGIITLQVKTFDPSDSERVAQFVVERSERLINDLSAKGRLQVLVGAKAEVASAEKRIADARRAVRDYRTITQEVDPVEGAKLAAQLIAGLETRLADLNTAMASARKQMSDGSPRIRVMATEIESIKRQIDTERQRLGSGNLQDKGNVSDVAGRIQKYETLETEREFADRAYTSALAGLEKARIDAGAHERYLAVFVPPTPSEIAQYPRRLLLALLVLFGCLMAWGVGVMGYYNIRDRA